MPRSTTETTLGRGVVILAHTAGMIDLVALPLWIGGLIQSRGLDPGQAGMLLTLFILGILISSLVVGPRFGRISNRATSVAGYGVCALCFLALTQVAGLPAYAVLHLLGGLGAGAGLACLHGTVGASRNPHRLFAVANCGMGAIAIGFFAVVPAQLAQHGVDAVFTALFLIIGVAALACLLAFPVADRAAAIAPRARERLRWQPSWKLAFAGVTCMAMAQSATFAFLQAGGVAHGFPPAAIGQWLAISAVVNMVSPGVAGLLQHRLSPILAGAGAIFVHGLAAATIFNTAEFGVFALAICLPVVCVQFGHTFIFGLIARLDPSSRLAALTPAMLNLGNTVGPAVGGLVINLAGWSVFGLVAGALAWAGACCFLAIGRMASVRALLRPGPALPLGA